MTLQLIVGRKKFSVSSLAEASATFCAHRDRMSFGSREMPDGKVLEGGSEIARVSYNGRVWAPGPWVAGATPLLEPAKAESSHVQN